MRRSTTARLFRLRLLIRDFLLTVAHLDGHDENHF